MVFSLPAAGVLDGTIAQLLQGGQIGQGNRVVLREYREQYSTCR